MEYLLGVQKRQPSACIHGKGQSESPSKLNGVQCQHLQQAPLATVFHHDGREGEVKQTAHKGAEVGMFQLSEGETATANATGYTPMGEPPHP